MTRKRKVHSYRLFRYFLFHSIKCGIIKILLWRPEILKFYFILIKYADIMIVTVTKKKKK